MSCEGMRKRLKAFRRTALGKTVEGPFRCPVCYRRALVIRPVMSYNYRTFTVSCTCGLKNVFRAFRSSLHEMVDYYNYWLDSWRILHPPKVEGSQQETEDSSIEAFSEEKCSSFLASVDWELKPRLSLSFLQTICGGSPKELYEALVEKGYIWIYERGGELVLSKEEVVPADSRRSVSSTEVRGKEIEIDLERCSLELNSEAPSLKTETGEELELSRKALRQLLRRLERRTVDPKERTQLSEEEYSAKVERAKKLSRKLRLEVSEGRVLKVRVVKSSLSSVSCSEEMSKESAA